MSDVNSRIRSVPRSPEAGQAVCAPHGVTSAENLVVGRPVLADLALHLFFDAGERVIAYLAYPRRLVLYAEEHGVLALDIVLPYSSTF